MADRYKIVKNDTESTEENPRDILEGGMTWFDNRQAKPVPGQKVFFQAGNRYFWGSYTYGSRRWRPHQFFDFFNFKSINDEDVARWSPLPVVNGIESPDAVDCALLVQESVISIARDNLEVILSRFNILDYLKPKSKPSKVLSSVERNIEEEDWEEDDPETPKEFPGGQAFLYNPSAIQRTTEPISGRDARETRETSETDNDDDFFDRLLDK